MSAPALDWRAVANTWRADTPHGTWIVEQGEDRVVLWFQARFTRGMMMRGEFDTVDAAKEHAQTEHRDWGRP